MKKYCFIVTDATSFNVLYRGQLEFLHQNSFNLTLICGGSQENIRKLQDRQVGEVIDVGMVRNPSFFSDLLCLIKLWWHLIFNRYDLVVVSTPKAILLGSLASFFSMQKKRITFFQGRVYENYRGLKRRVYIFLDYLAIRLTHQSLFVSPSLKDEFTKDISLVAAKGFVVGAGSGNGINTDRFDFREIDYSVVSDLQQKLGIATDDFVMLSIGRICKDKGMFEIAEISKLLASQNKRFRFLMLGSVEDKFFYTALSELLEQGTVLHIGFVDDIRPYLALANVHLFLTHREGFGNVAIEAAAMNVPTFAYDVVGVRDSVAEGVSGLKFPFKDVAAVCNALQYHAHNTEQLRQQFSGARAWAQTNYAQQEVWEKYKDYYSELSK